MAINPHPPTCTHAWVATVSVVKLVQRSLDRSFANGTRTIMSLGRSVPLCGVSDGTTRLATSPLICVRLGFAEKLTACCAPSWRGGCCPKAACGSPTLGDTNQPDRPRGKAFAIEAGQKTGRLSHFSIRRLLNIHLYEIGNPRRRDIPRGIFIRIVLVATLDALKVRGTLPAFGTVGARYVPTL